METKKLIIIGCGGNSLDICDTVSRINKIGGKEIFKVEGFLDDQPTLHGKTVCGVKVFGSIKLAPNFKEHLFVFAIGSVNNIKIRDKILKSIKVPVEKFVTLVDPLAFVSQNSKIGTGSIVFPGVFIGTYAEIGNFTMILPNSSIHHHAKIGDFTLIASNVAISGGVLIGKNSFIGAGATVIAKKIENHTIIGAGSVVVKEINEPNCIVTGNPARKLK